MAFTHSKLAEHTILAELFQCKAVKVVQKIQFKHTWATFRLVYCFPIHLFLTMFRKLIRIHFITTPFQPSVRVCVALKSIAGNIRASAAALPDLTQIIQMSADVPSSFPAKSKTRHSYQVKLRRFSPHNGHSRKFIGVGPTNHSASVCKGFFVGKAWFTFQTIQRQRE